MTRIYRKVYRDEVQTLGIVGAYVLAEIRAYSEFCQRNDQIAEDGFFELSTSKFEEMTGIERHQQTRIIDKLASSGMIEKKIVGRDRYIKLYGTKCSHIGNKMFPHMEQNVPTYGTNCSIPYYNKTYDKYFDKFVISYLTKKQQQTLEKVIEFFIVNGQEQEAVKFINYNLENYGEDHITEKNYKSLATKWLKAKKSKPKKRQSSGRGKTAREAADEAGVSVEEFLQIKPQPVTINPDEITTDDGIDSIIDDLLGGGRVG